MVNKKIIKEVSINTGLPDKTVEKVIKDYIKKNDILLKKDKNTHTVNNDQVLTFLINSINEIVEKVLQGEIPALLQLPDSMTDKNLLSFTDTLNNGLILYRDVAEYIENLASGSLDSEPPPGNSKMISALKKLQSELKQLVTTAEHISSENISGQFNNMKSISSAFSFIRVQLQKSFDKINIQKQELIKANNALIMANTMEARDMDMAVTVQRSLMPDSPPRSTKWEIAYFFKPMAGVSGDFYDFYLDNDELSGVSLFDVSGHGISSALISMVAKWIIYQSFHKYFNKSFRQVPLEISRELNAAIGKSDYYLTGVIIKFEGDNIKYINASHPDVYIKKKDGNVLPLRNASGQQPAGILFGMNIEPAVYDEITCSMETGDCLLLYTDGLSECCNLTGADYGALKLQKSFSDINTSATSQETLNLLIKNVYNFMGKDSFDDDCTVIVIKKIR